ncbi:MAG: hypothetical protein WD049_02685 [Candidatus Paceibacterota bacterium]
MCARFPAGPFLFDRLSADAAVFPDNAIREDEKQTAAMWGDCYPWLHQEYLDFEKGCLFLRPKHIPRTDR